MFKFCRYSVLI